MKVKKRILIICTYYPPDSSIAAVRPYMFAKYLAKMGNNVTVIRSGEMNCKPSKDTYDTDGIEVISYLINVCDNDYNYEEKGVARRTTFDFLPGKFRNRFAWVFHRIVEPISIVKRLLIVQRKFKSLKRCLDSLKSYNERFDIVFATYSDIENIYGGQYAAKLFDAKLIQDFRDPVTAYNDRGSFLWNFIAKLIQKNAVHKADMCSAVSAGVAEQLAVYDKVGKIVQINNGYEEVSGLKAEKYKDLTICYTGSIYTMQLQALDIFAKCLKSLVCENRLDINKIQFIYAGGSSDLVREVFEKHEIDSIFRDYGYISKHEVETVQFSSDLFLVLSWNSFKSYGVVSGKFYEGIRASIPILSIVAGNRTKSELLHLQEKYQYGFCYECANGDMEGLKNYIVSLFKEKERKGTLSYCPNEKLFEDFKYENLALFLSKKMDELLCED